MLLEEIYELTDAYLAGDLSEEEAQAFELRCQNEPSFGQEVHLYIASLGEIQTMGEAQLKGQLMDRFPEAPVIPMRSGSSRRPWYLAAAAALTLLLLSVWWLTQPSTPTDLPPQDLYAQYMEVPEVSSTRAPSLDSLAPKWMDALMYLRDSSFEQAIPLLESSLQDSSFFAKYGGQAVLYLGTAQMEDGRYEAALKSFSRIDSENPYFDQIIWYRALCHMQLEQSTEAMALLTEIGETEFHFKRAKALEILAQYPPK